MEIVPYAVAAYTATESNNLKIAVNSFPLVTGMIAGTPAIPFDQTAQSFPGPTTTPLTEAGDTIRTSFDDWYYRIHLVPSYMDLGNLSGNQQRELILWNAYLNPVALQNFVLDNALGLEFDTTTAAPATLAALQVVHYDFYIDANGPPVINATATWTIDGIDYVVPIVGRRTVLFAFSPNWEQPVTETLEWKTTVETTYSGLEQRVKVRDVPRRIFDFQVRLREEHVNNFDNVMFGWTGRMFALPLWHEKNTLTADATVGSLALTFNTANCTYAPGSVAVIYKNSELYEIVEVETVSPTGVTVVGPLINAWPRGSGVFPVLVAIPNGTVGTTRRVPNHVDAVMRFTANPTDVIARLPIVAAPATYRSEELYTLETNWIVPLAGSIVARQKLAENGQGPMRLTRKADFPQITRGFRWMCKTRAIAEDLRAFLVRRRGRQKPVWMPSGAEDFKLIENIAISQTAFNVRRNDYDTLIVNHGARRDVVFIMRDGARYARRINSIEDDGASSLMVVDSGFPVEIRPQDVKRISYLGLYRLGADTVSFTWQTAQVAECQVNFVLIKGPA